VGGKKMKISRDNFILPGRCKVDSDWGSLKGGERD